MRSGLGIHIETCMITFIKGELAMTGRQLIIFILENNLENIEIVDAGKLKGVMTLDKAAVKWDTGVHTLKALFSMGKIPGIEIDGTIYIYEWAENPFKKENKR